LISFDLFSTQRGTDGLLRLSTAAGWNERDGRTGGVVLAVEDAPAGVMSWFEIEQAWLKTNDCGSATGSDCNVPRH
jgi:hypothetical protein